MKIGIVGTGNMGRSLGILWAQQGYKILFGARDANKAKEAVQLAGNNARAGSNDDAAAFGEVVFYSPAQVPVEKVLQQPDVLKDKVVIDCSNWNIPENFQYEPVTRSIAEKLAEQIPNARVVKAFNTMGMEVFELCPDEIRPHKVSCFICSDDESAKEVVMELAQAIAFVGVDCGSLRNARLLESTADLLRYLAITNESWTQVISTYKLPQPTTNKLGGRKTSNLY